MTSYTVTSTLTSVQILSDSDSLTLTSSGTIIVTSVNAAVDDFGSIGTLSNAGEIEGGNGILAYASISSLTNTGKIIGNTNNAISSEDGIGTLTNSGMINGSNAGISTEAISNVTNTDGVIEGGYYGIISGTLTSLNNSTDASISGGVQGVVATSGIGTLSNDGIISANSSAILSLGTISALTNDGTIKAYIGIYASAIGSLNNNGDITGTAQAITLDTGSLTNLDNESGGVISGSTVAVGVAGGIATLTNNGTITAGDTAINSNGTIGLLTNAGTITANDYAILSGSAGGTLILDPTSVISGQVEFNDGTLELAGSTANTVTGIGNQYSGFTSISFDNTDATAEGSTGGLAGGETITGFTSGDEIQLDSFVAVSKDYVTGEGLVLTDKSSNTETLNIQGPYTTAEFVITNDGTNTTIELCYLRGTRILTPNGEVPVESLQIGDLVVTRQGGFRAIKWIGRQSYDRRFVATDPARLPVRIRPGALGEGLPARDLYISPGHSMLVDGTLLLASTLVNGINITHECPNDTTQIDYFHPELQSHDCILAEGAWSETFADGPGLRAAFYNAPEFWALYPTYQTPDTINLCAPRPERGAALQTALRPLVARAAKGVAPGHLQGFIDRISGREIDGWAFDAANPHLPVLIEVTLDGAVIHTALACDFRQDLRDAGFGLGRCAFFLALPEDIPAGVLQIRRAGDGATLPMSETCCILRAA